jgi:deoxycytidine triphosphate deaminase
MILSDHTIREELAAGRIVIDPLDEKNIQPSSVDLHVDRYFRVFRNDTTPYIDPKDPQEDLTELVEVKDGQAFILHPGEFVLGSTSERVSLPDDLVARLEGKSSLGRLGLLIHSSLPAGERVAFLDHEGHLALLPIEEIVRKQRHGQVVAFDPDSFEVSYHEVTGWFEGPPDRVYEVVLGSGRSVRVTAGHNLFTLDRDGALTKVRTGELRPGTRVAIPRRVPDPPVPHLTLDVLALAPESVHPSLMVSGPTVARAFAERRDEVVALLRTTHRKHVGYYQGRSRLPLTLARQLPGLLDALGQDDRISVRGSSHGLPPELLVDDELAWLIGLYVAEGSRRRGQVVWSNTDEAILDRTEEALTRLCVPVSREAGRKITACSKLLSYLIDWLDAGPDARPKRVPSIVFGWPQPLIERFLEGFVDGDGSREATRVSWWSSSPALVDDLLYLAGRTGRRASASLRVRDGRPLFQVSVPHREHKLLTAVPLPDRLLARAREGAGLPQVNAAVAAGYRHASDLNNIERRCGRDAVRLATLRRLRDTYGSGVRELDRLIDGDLLWDTVTAVRDTGEVEPIYDLEVRPGGRKVENFLAGTGGVFVSNTAGFVDAGWDGHLTLELSNVANLPIAIYPGMKIGQISFLRMTTPADIPYGSDKVGSKYQGQRGPTPSRYYENFRED